MLPTHSAQRSAYLRVRDIARELRKKQTPAEEFFWSQVRNRGLFGLKINRQQIIQCPLDPAFTKFYIADFYCHQLKLIIELDGSIHELQKEQDLVRTEYMEANGYKLMRFTNEQVLYNWIEVIECIRQLLNDSQSTVAPLSS